MERAGPRAQQFTTGWVQRKPVVATRQQVAAPGDQRRPRPL